MTEYYGNKSWVELLLKCDDVNINTRKHIEGKTPLFLACENGYSSVVEVLLNKTDINVNKGIH